MLQWYRLPWRIENWHRVMKAGCQVEDLANRLGLRFEQAVAINVVIDWPLHLLVQRWRETSQLTAETLFSDIEIWVVMTSRQSAASRRRGAWAKRCC